MRILAFYIPVLFLLIACDNTKPTAKSLDPINWEKRRTEIQAADSLIAAKTYLGIYSQIYSTSEHNTHDLTVTASLRNTSETQSVILTKGVYYDTAGNPIRTYFDFPIKLNPLETVEIIVEEGDKSGGTGGNFIFDWLDDPEVTDPLFEGIMISTRGTQGLSFTVQGKRIL